ncbi:MAG: alpha-2-macroglobulin [Blastocatellia bacterium AA13]|nr:MAG: alpha-2-macroglobulin [Blastocatellia bacterium AA13]
MKTIIVLVLLLAFGLAVTHAYQIPQTDYDRLKSEAEQLYVDGSYGKSHDVYLKMRALNLSPKDSRWVDFRLADTEWRAQDATRTSDNTKYEEARRALEALVRDTTRVEDHDPIWAEVQESLGDFWWTRNSSKNWGQGWQFYQQALDWWAGSADIDTARDRYLKIVWKIAKPAWNEPYYYYGYYGNFIPREILENGLKIAKTTNDQAHLHYLLAMTIRGQGGSDDEQQRVPEEFEAAIKPGKTTDWYDDALYYYAEWMVSYGRRVQLANGQWTKESDYPKALELLRRFASEHQKGESRFYDQVKSQIEEITAASVSLSVSSVFLPDSEIQFDTTWRNVKRIDFALYKVDLTRDVRFSNRDDGDDDGSGVYHIVTNGRDLVKSWAKDTGDKGDYVPGQELVRLDRKLPAGAYAMEVSSGKVKARDLILVTDTSLVLKTSGTKALVYYCNAVTGAPVAEAAVKLWQQTYDGNRYVWVNSLKSTNADGIAVFDLKKTIYNGQVYATAALADRQAFASGYGRGYVNNNQPWKIYAFTDRPAYRPGESVQWKFVARLYANGVYSTPANQTIEYEAADSRGTKVLAGKAPLNSFGSVWGSLDLKDSMALGEYRVTFWDAGRHNQIGNAVLFRLEEYKLPEFKVSVKTPEEDGKKKTFRMGEKVGINIQADYYFGGGVANATVEVLVYQNPFYRYWHQSHEYEWYYDDNTPRYYNYGGRQGQVIKREVLKTDAAGRASLTFDTPRGSQQDFEYLVEARVTDSSRREIAASNTVRVTRQRYYVQAHTGHYLYKPQDKVEVDIKALDANDQPVSTEGRVKVTRDYWYEIWIDPNGNEVKGAGLKALKDRGAFPPPVTSGTRPWQLKFQGYEHEDVTSLVVKTDAQGDAQFSFTPGREGYYRAAWTSEDKGAAPITGETAVWVATGASTDLGYRHGGLEIIVDKDSFRAGQRAPVMLVAPTNDRYVLFGVEGEEIYNYQLVHMTGAVKLIEFPVEDKHVPNVLLSAAMVSDRQIFVDTKQVIVPPVEHFLSVDVKTDRSEYQPREEGTLTVTARDVDGKPVSAEVAMGLVDESVFYIQGDYAGDPRQFYYGQKRQQYVQTTSTFQQKSYTKLVEGANKTLVDDRISQLQKDEEGRAVNGRGPGRGYGGSANGVIDGVNGADRAFGTTESVTVTAGAQSLALLAPASAPADSFKAKAAKELDAGARDFRKDAAGRGEPAVQVRNDFRSTALWIPDVMTDKNGKASVKVKFPDSLTGWTATARAATDGNQFGIGHATVLTKQPLICRLEAPRFFVAGDLVTISAVINNNTDAPMNIAPSIAAQGVMVTGLMHDGKPAKGEQGPINVAANGEARVDWLVAVKDPGNAMLKVSARGSKFSDAMEKRFVVYEHGIEKFVSKSGKVRGEEVTVKLNIPAERKHDSTTLTVQIAPTMAVTMLDALPYLIDYPYGCTEQTMSRFLPAVITRKTLSDLGFKPENIMGRIFGGIEQDTANQTHPRGAADLRKLDEMVKQGLDRLYGFQHADGGWGWWKDGESDHFMTAYVVWGFCLARSAGVDIKSDVLQRGAAFLDKTLVDEELNFDMQAFMLHALAAYHETAGLRDVSRFQDKAVQNLWDNRDRLNAYTRSLFALGVHYFGYTDKARTLIANLENGVKIDSAPDTSIIQRGPQQSHDAVIGTAHWGEDGVYWRWSDGGVEATSFALRALLAIDPKNKLIEPVTNWLIKNRRGSQWSNTRDTAITILTLNDYLKQSGEMSPNVAYDLVVNGQPVASKRLTAEDALSAPSKFTVDRRYIRDGENDIRITRRGGDGPIYFAANAEFFSTEEPITEAGNEIFVRRDYYKLVGRPTLLKGYAYERLPLRDGETVSSGDGVEVVLTVEAKNNYEYLLFEDLKPAGLEAVEIQSGESMYAKELKSGAVARLFGEHGSATESNSTKPIAQPVALVVKQNNRMNSQRRIQASGQLDNEDYTGRTRWVYQELRDRKVAMFIDKLPEGVWEMRYDLRAEAPGVFHALPVVGHAMYTPEIRCNGTEARIRVEDKH